MVSGAGFIAALDQSGGSTPGALKAYGIPEEAWSCDAEMFNAMHEMRVRVMTAPAFTGRRILAAILFEATMERELDSVPVPVALWRRGIVPFLKVDRGLEPEADGVQLMKPIPDLYMLLQRAKELGVFGTKARSLIRSASATGIRAVVAQQFDIAAQIARRGLLPILEPEVSLQADDRLAAETMLHDALLDELNALQAGRRVMLKLTIPAEPDRYADLAGHPAVARVVALSGGYSRPDACAALALNRGLIASFSRALLADLRHGMEKTEFDHTLEAAIEEIYAASTFKS
jgi:fructose-bisphosphate aldolase class I